MPADRATCEGDRDGLTPLLVGYHEALVIGGAPAGAPDQGPQEPWLERAMACLRALERFRHDHDEKQRRETIDQDQFGDDGAADFELATAPRPFGRFAVIEELGRGGHGIVYRAWDPVLQRDVALKIPRIEILDSAEHRERFIRESRSVASLSHPNLVPVYESGEVGPACYLALQYCPGPTLAQWLVSDSGPVSQELAATLIAVLAETVDYVHSRGILHRDIKPANVLIEFGRLASPASPSKAPPDGAFAAIQLHQPQLERRPGRNRPLPFTPRLTDFGLAKVLEQPAARTRTGAVLGTPQYMAPEQAGGRAREVGAAADIYALGAILYELLTGRPPCRGETDLETLRMAAEGRVAPPRRVRRGISPDLEAVCLKCLEFEPSRRYATAAGLADDLYRYLNGESVSVRPPGPIGQLMRWRRRKPTVAALALALVLALSGGLAAVLFERKVAEAHRSASEQNLEVARQTIREVHETLYAEDAYDAPQFQPLRKELLEVALKRYGDLEEQTTDPRLRAELAEACFHAGVISYTSGDRNAALESHRRALPFWRTLAREEPDVLEHRYYLAKTLEQIGLILRGRGEIEPGRQAGFEAMSIREELAACAPHNLGLLSDLAESYGGLGAELQNAGQNEEAGRLLNRSRELHERLIARGEDMTRHHMRLGGTLHALARLAAATGNRDEALELCAQTVRLLEGLVADERWLPGSLRDLGQSLHFQGTLCSALQRPHEALACQQRAAACFERLVDEYPQKPGYRIALANTYRELASLNRAQGNFSSAVELCGRARAIQERLLRDAPDNDDYACYAAATCRETAAVYLAQQQPEKSLVFLEMAEHLYRELFSRHPDSVSYRENLAAIQGRIAESKRRIESTR